MSKAFTLFEVLVAVVLLASLAAASLPLIARGYAGNQRAQLAINAGQCLAAIPNDGLVPGPIRDHPGRSLVVEEAPPGQRALPPLGRWLLVRLVANGPDGKPRPLANRLFWRIGTAR